jgi:Mrp family chromosome partitioning ATPase
VVFVIRVGKTPNDVLRRVVDQIESVKGRILGVVLNRVDPRRDGYYYYYRAYQRYYGADEGNAKH